MPFEPEKSDFFIFHGKTWSSCFSWDNMEMGGPIFNCVLKGVSHGLTLNKKNCTRFPYPGTPPKRFFRMISCFFAI